MTGRASNIGANGRTLSRLPVCGHSIAPGDPTVPLCNRPAVVHVTPLEHGVAAGWTLQACELHAALLLQPGTYWDAHRITEACSHPASLWVKGEAFRASGCAMPRESTRLAP